MTNRSINRAGVITAKGRCPCTCHDEVWVSNSCQQEPCCSECDPMPCAFEILLPCVAYVSYIGGMVGGSPIVACGTITFRQDCVSPNEECIFYAVGAAAYHGYGYNFWVSSSGGDSEDDFCASSGLLNGWFLGPYQWGIDWCRTDAASCVPCTWGLRGPGLGDYPFPPYWVKFDLSTHTVSAGPDAPSDWPTFPTYTLREGDTWDCYACNTIVTTDLDGAYAWGLPTQLAIRAKDVPAAHFCNTNGDQALPDCGYDTKANLCECCDECCDELPDQPLWLKCAGCTESATVTPTIGGGNGLDGVDSPSGPTYGACATLCGYEVCGNWYCSGGQWKLDGYVDGVFCGTGDLTHTCCPLELGGTTLSGCIPSGCDICVGTDCEPACDCSTLLTDLANVTVSSSGGGSTTLPNNVTDWSQLTSLDSLPVTLTFDCVDSTNYTLAVVYEPGNPGYVGFGNYTSASGVCSPLEAVFNNVDLGDGVLKTITVTA